MRARTVRIVSLLLLAWPAAVHGGKKVTLCHVPPGNPANRHTISVSESAVSAHLAHGDRLGTCPATCPSSCDDAAGPNCHRCGDGVVQPGEECDDGNDNPFDGCDRCIAVDTSPD
jgi:cysteine-rich repeat protein